MMDCPFGTVIPLAGHAEEAARTGPLATCRTRRRSSCRSRLLQVNWPNFGGSVVETRSALWLSLGQLCLLSRAAEHASRGCGDLHGAPVQNLVVPINDCQQRMPDNAHLRIGFISRR